MKRCMLYAVALLFLIGCGSGSVENNNPSPNPSSGSGVSSQDVEAISGSLFDVSVESSSKGNGIASDRAKQAEDLAVEEVKTSISDHVTQMVADEILYEAANSETGKDIGVSNSGNTRTVTITNEKISIGGGTITIDGSFTMTRTSNAWSTTADITAKIENVTDTETINNVAYTETVNGTLTMKFSGNYEMITDGSGTITGINCNISVTVTGQNIEVTGTANGTITNVDLSFSLTGNTLQPLTMNSSCSGSISVTTASGTQTCNVKEDCSGCK